MKIQNVSPEGEWLLLALRLPGSEAKPYGIVLLDPQADELHVKLREDSPALDDDVLLVWDELQQDLLQRAEHSGASAFVDWLEESASHFVEVSSRRPVKIDNVYLTLDALYKQHVYSFNS